MKSIQVYLTFNGNCGQAMKFYKECLGGELMMMPFSEMPAGECEGMNMKDANLKDRVMHARLTKGAATMMASDTMPGHAFNQGNSYSVSVDCASSDEVKKFHKALSAGGKSTMDPQDTFWGAHFAMCTDKFGVQWMFNHDKK